MVGFQLYLECPLASVGVVACVELRTRGDVITTLTTGIHTGDRGWSGRPAVSRRREGGDTGMSSYSYSHYMKDLCHLLVTATVSKFSIRIPFFIPFMLPLVTKFDRL